MEKKERVEATLNHKKPDRIPTISCMDVQRYVYETLNETPDNTYKYLVNPITAKIIDIISPLLNLMNVFDKDVTEFMLKKTESDVKMGFDSTWNIFASIFRFINSKYMNDVYGGRIYKIGDDGYGNMDTPMFIKGTFETPDDWRRFNKKHWEALPENMFKFNTIINREFGSDIYIFGSLFMGLFENAWQPFGFNTFAKFLRKERGFLEELIEYNKNMYLKCLDASIDAGLPGFIVSDDQAYKSGPMVNPKIMDELFGKPYKEITDHAHKKGVPIVIHTDGWTIPLLKYYKKWGFDGQHALEPTANVDLADVRKEIGDKFILLGHIDIAHVLTFGTRDEVFAHVKESIKKGGKNGNLILGPCNSHADIKVENMKWMMEAIEEYGHYPIKV